MPKIDVYRPGAVEAPHTAVSMRRVYDAAHIGLNFRELNEFPKDDPWHAFFEGLVRRQASLGEFSNAIILEGGIGVGSLMLEAIFATDDAGLPAPQHIIGVDIQPVALDLAHHHLQQVGFENHTLWHAGVIQYLQAHEAISATVGIFCLPQVPDPYRYRKKPALRVSESDSYDPAYVPEEYRRYGDVGLALVAGTLAELHRVATPDFTAYVIISGRVPRARRDEIIALMGWTILEEFITETPIQQDPDTPLHSYLPTAHLSDEERFFEQTGDGEFRAISVKDAVDRTAEEGVSRDTLNVHHHLSVLRLRKAEHMQHVN